MKLYSINSGYFKLDGGAMFGVVPKSIWNKLNPADENNMCNWAMRCLLIEDGKRLILVDNGMGDKQDAKFFSYYYLNGDDTLDKSLARYGFHRNDITDVFLTHLHFDHCGGSIVREHGKLVPAFKNAIFWSNELHWQAATDPNEREKASFLKENILPIQESGHLKFIYNDSPGQSANEYPGGHIREYSFTEGIQVMEVNGHTRSMMLPKINYHGKTLVYVADLVPSQGHIPIPYIMAYDMQPLITLQEKKIFLKESVENDYVFFFEHDPQYECCTLERTGKGIKAKELFRLDEVFR